MLPSRFPRGFLAALAVASAAAAPDSLERKEAPPWKHVTKSAFLLPSVSVILPGFGQFWHGEASAWAYTGAGLGGLALMVNGASEMEAEAGTLETDPTEGIESWSLRKVVLGALAYQGSGLVSAYSAFRTSVPAFQAEKGKYTFLAGEETVGDLFLSPFRFGHLHKPSTLIPLGILTGVVGYFVVDERLHHDREWVFSADDLVFTGLVSYNAGVTEEAAFRGWLLPLAYQTLGQTWWAANGAQALLFAAAHYNERNQVPWPQALMGYYTGYLTRKNGWTLSEAIFLHFWWDAILFSGMYLTLHEVPAGSFRIELPVSL